jgi:hypothetical protein
MANPNEPHAVPPPGCVATRGGARGHESWRGAANGLAVLRVAVALFFLLVIDLVACAFGDRSSGFVLDHMVIAAFAIDALAAVGLGWFAMRAPYGSRAAAWAAVCFGALAVMTVLVYWGDRRGDAVFVLWLFSIPVDVAAVFLPLAAVDDTLRSVDRLDVLRRVVHTRYAIGASFLLAMVAVVAAMARGGWPLAFVLMLGSLAVALAAVVMYFLVLGWTRHALLAQELPRAVVSD